MKQVRFGPTELNPLFADFARYYGFAVKTHRIRRPHTTGKIEHMVHYVKDAFLNGRIFTDLAGLNAQGRSWLAQTANARIHATTSRRLLQELNRRPHFPLEPSDLPLSQEYHKGITAGQLVMPVYPEGGYGVRRKP
jgi:hypothetical protein